MVDARAAGSAVRARVKLLLIPILGIVLLIVLFNRPQSPDDDTLATASVPESNPTVASEESRSSPDLPVAENGGARKTIPLEIILAHDPFELPAALQPDDPVSLTTASPTAAEIELANR